MSLKENRIRTMLRLSSQAFGRYKRQIFYLTALGLLGGLLESVGINAIIPLFSFLVGGSGTNDAISNLIRQFFSFLNINFSLRYLLVFISFLFIIKAFFVVISNYISMKIITDYEQKMRNLLLNITLKSGWSYLIKQKLGHLENILMTDLDHSSILLQQMSSAIITAASLLVYLIVALSISAPTTLITVFLGGIIFFLFKPVIYKVKVLGGLTSGIYKKIAHFVNETILGIKTIKAINSEQQVLFIGERHFDNLKRLKMKVMLLKNVSNALFQPLTLVFICIVFAISYKLPNFSLAKLIVIIYLIQKIFQYIQLLQLSLHTMNENVPYLKNVLDYEKAILATIEENNGTETFSFTRTLDFKNIKFSYQTDRTVLYDVNFSIRRGEMIGLIGPSGAGKTTIVDLILRLINPSAGQIFLDGKDSRQVEIGSWRKNIGYISQDMFLMNDTIANNIRFFDETITDEELTAVTKMANIYDFIENCPDKFETQIGERGLMMSVGQRQRIIIARMLARKPQLLVLDEATSALDNESEIQIQRVIENLKGKLTVLIIAHRLSTVKNCDNLLVLDQGKIMEQGQPQKLLEDPSSYYYRINNLKT